MVQHGYAIVCGMVKCDMVGMVYGKIWYDKVVWYKVCYGKVWHVMGW